MTKTLVELLVEDQQIELEHPVTGEIKTFDSMDVIPSEWNGALVSRWGKLRQVDTAKMPHLRLPVL